jgi:hypothetical protein
MGSKHKQYIFVHGIKVSESFVPERFGRLTTVGPVFYVCGQRLQVCACDCGKCVIVHLSNLTQAKTRSCGCLNAEKRRTSGIKHGHVANGKWSLTYKSWAAMTQRCQYAQSNRYYRYGGRGIEICERWIGRDGFANFLADMGERPSKHHTIDRIDNDGNYCPENCRWATREEQMRNRSNARILTHQGISQTVAAWSSQTGMDRHTIVSRIDVLGWSVDKALTTPPRNHRRTKEESQ